MGQKYFFVPLYPALPTCSGNARRVLQQVDVAGKGQYDPTSEKEPAQKSKISITMYTVQLYKICLINLGKRVFRSPEPFQKLLMLNMSVKVELTWLTGSEIVKHSIKYINDINLFMS